MNRNYEIVQGIHLVQGNHELDMHNNFDFKSLEYSVEERKLVLRWLRSEGDWVSPNIPRAVAICFSEVSEFRFMPRDHEMPHTEDDCIDTFGYWVDEEWAEGVIMIEPNERVEPHWLTAIDFMSGAVLAVQAGSAHAKVTA